MILKKCISSVHLALHTYHVNIMNPKYFIRLKKPDFQRSTIPLKLIILIKTAKESHSDIHNASFGTLKAKIDRPHSSQSMFE